MTAWITSTVGLCVAALILWLIRRDRLHVDHGLMWISVAVAFALLGFAPGVVDWVAGRLGIAYPPILGVIIALALLVLKILLMDIERSHIAIRTQRLTQRVAMLEAEIEEQKNRGQVPFPGPGSGSDSFSPDEENGSDPNSVNRV